jgi:hypothetical protein
MIKVKEEAMWIFTNKGYVLTEFGQKLTEENKKNQKEVLKWKEKN